MTVWLLALAYLILINLFTAGLWGHDKACAVARRSRVPESTLLGLCFLGGWPGGMVAAHLYRHKTSKTAFIAKVAVIVALQVALLCTAIVLF